MAPIRILLLSLGIFLLCFSSMQITQFLALSIGPRYVIRCIEDSSGNLSAQIQLECGGISWIGKAADHLLGGNFTDKPTLAAQASANLTTAVSLTSPSPSEQPLATPTPAPTQAPSIGESGIEYIEKTIGPTGGNIKLSDTLTIKDETGYTLDAAQLLSDEVPFTVSGTPQVLIVHTHTTESYAPSLRFQFSHTSNDRTTDTNYNMARIGKELQKELAALGVVAIHNETLHDYPNYNSSYANSCETIEKELAKYPDIKIVLDLHRDAISPSGNQKVKLVDTIDGEKVAQVMLVVGTDQLGLAHDTWRTNLKFSLMLQKNFMNVDKNFARPVNLRSSRFNGHTAPGAVIIEVGSSGNTFDECLASVKYIAQAVRDTIEQLK